MQTNEQPEKLIYHIFTQLDGTLRSLTPEILQQGDSQVSGTGFQARSKDQEILEEGGGAGPSLLPRRDHE